MKKMSFILSLRQHARDWMIQWAWHGLGTVVACVLQSLSHLFVDV